MNVNSKPEFHPDAESLNAFAEEALDAQEREEMVAHLAECGRCREVVFLARAAVEEMEPELAVAAAVAVVPDTGVRKSPWFRSWRLAWVPVGALAATMTVAYVVHVRHRELAAEQELVAAVRTSQIAKVEMKPPITMQSVPPANAPQMPVAKMQKPVVPTVAVKEVTPMAPPPPAGGMAATSSAEVALSHGAVPAPAKFEAAVQEPEARIAERREAVERASAAYQSSVTADKRLRTSAGGVAKETQSRGLMAAAPAPDAFASLMSEHGVASSSKAKRPLLPSGLAAMATAANQNCRVAVDAAGGVFVSVDTGSHWESVAKQWNGRPVAVRRGTGADSVIELVNDQGQVWESSDGRTWKAK